MSVSKIRSLREGVFHEGRKKAMAQNRTSDNVVMPDITEVSEDDPLATDTERESDRTDGGTVLASEIKTARLSSDSNGVITVPVSLPVGTLITGTTFNVITSDQLPHFKPMLCVDNGFISGGPVTEDIKATHIVIQNSPPPSGREQSNEDASSSSTPPSRAANARTWTETALMPVLPVRCKNTSAELHKHRFGSGGRGRCIKYGMKWLTPSEFEAMCGRASSKDWKRSIRFGGRSIQALIDEGILAPHATSCTCGACCDDQSAMGPVRLFTPYKRKRRNQEPEEKKKPKRESVLAESDVDSIHQTSNNSHSKEAWQTITDGLESSNEYHIMENPETKPDPTLNSEKNLPARNDILRDQAANQSLQTASRKIKNKSYNGKPEDYNIISGLPDLSSVLKRLEDIGQSLVRVANELKQCVDDVRIISTRQLERLEQERTSAILSAGVEAEVDVEQVTLHNVEDTVSKKCANCNREASAECSLCRRTPYCSTYCQKKDWSSHQIECLRSVPIHTDSNQHQSIMFIVESQHQ
ncbi:PREDICTED: deformed epidermal autoregulatory factor 1 homolog isoform X2 [Papilio xuthus]|uniref:Deformed epidermal autoregulatory factor 1 homolog isoform X2 n=2 Tax=Papilio xuthus TaxID=66420 RepID=A0AAJ6ZUS5_PAPXU|nr:PREDICTED: deformed epidermal autoregulatory factor 1 homolog isoform X2 [Papilio xuthus]